MAKKNYDAASDYLEKKYGKKTETSSQNASSDPASQYLQNKYGNKQSKKQEARQSFSDRYNAAQYDQRSSVDKNNDIQSRIYETNQRRADATERRMQYYKQKLRDAKNERSYQQAEKAYDDTYKSWLQAYQNQQRTGENLLRNSMRMPEQELPSGQLPNTEPKRSDIERTIRERQRQEAAAKQRKAAAEAALNQGYSYQGGMRPVDPAQYAQLQKQARAAAEEYEAAKRGTAEAEARLRAHDEQLEQRRIEEILSANRSDLERTARGARQMEAIAKDNLERARNAFGYGIDEGQSYADAQAKAEQEYAQAVKRSEQAADALNLYDAFYRDARMNYVEAQIKNDPAFRDKARTGRVKWEQEQAEAKAAARSADARTAMAQGALGGDVNPLILWQAMRENADAAGVRRDLETTFSPDGLTEDQKDIFFALWAEDPQLAERWAELAKQKVDEKYLKQVADWAGKNPGTRLLANFAGSNLSLASGLDPFGEAGQAANKLGQTLVSGGAQGLTEKGLLNTGFGAGTIQETTPVVGWLLKGKGLGDLYQLTSSMIQSGETALFAAMTGGLGAFAGTSLMGSAAAASDYAEQLERGVDQRTATVHATAAGVAEALFEYVSLDKLLDQDVTAAFLKNFLQQGGVEASEEICTSLANRISDGLILHANGYDSDIDRRRRELMAQGANYQDASARAEWDWIVDVLNDGLGGFLSGGMMTAGNYIPGAVAGLEQRALRNYLDRQMQKLGLSENDLDVNTEYDDGLGVNGPGLGRVGGEDSSAAPQNDMRGNAVQDFGGQVARAAVGPGDPAATGFGGQVARATVDGGQVARATVGPGDQAATGSGGQIARATDDGGQVARAAGWPGDPAATGFGGQIARATETGGLNNGTDSRTAGAEGLDDGAQRDAGLGAAEQAAGVEGRAGRQLAGGQTRESDARRKAAIAAYTAEPRSARDLGIRGGSSNASLQLIEDQSIWTSDMQAAYEDARASGHEIRFVKGPIEVWNPQAKEYATVNGVHQTNADGSVQYYIRADSRMRSAGQLYRHEVFHELVDNNPQLWQQLAGYLKGNYSKAEVMRLLEAYVDAYNGIYGKDESSEMRYLEEAFADTYAEIQRGRADTRTVRETMQAFGDQIDNARRNAQTSEATRETRGNPEQRYSFKDSERIGFDTLIHQFYDNKLQQSNPIYIGEGFASMQSMFQTEAPLMMLSRDLRKSIRTDKGNSRSAHGVSEAYIRNLPENIQNAVFGYTEDRNGVPSFTVLSYDADSRKLYAIGGELNTTYENRKVNKLHTIFAVDHLDAFLTKSSKQFVTTDIEKAQHILEEIGVQFPALQNILDSMRRITQTDAGVNRHFDDGLGISAEGLGRVGETRGSPEQRYSMEMFNDESDSDKAKRLKNASVEIVQASPESLQAAANIDVSNSKAQDTASILFPILEEFGIFGNQYNQALEIEFDYSKTAGARSLSHQIEITGKNYTAQALVQTNLRELCEKAYPVEAHADEKASDPEAALKQIITLYSALQAGDDAVFAKMTIKIPQKESNRLHMVVTSEVKKGFDLALIAEATKPLSADKSNPRISIPAFLENVKNIGEFTKRIPVDLVLGESANYKDGLGVSGPGLGRVGETQNYSMEEEDSSAAPQNDRDSGRLSVAEEEDLGDGLGVNAPGPGRISAEEAAEIAREFESRPAPGQTVSQEKVMRDMDRRERYSDRQKNGTGRSIEQRAAAMEDAENRRQESFEALMEQKNFEDVGMGEPWKEYEAIREQRLQEELTDEDLARIKQNRERKKEQAKWKAERKNIDALQKQVQADENELRGLENAKKLGAWSEQADQRYKELQDSLEVNRKALQEKKDAKKQAEAKEKKAAAAEVRAKQAKQEFKKDVMGQFSTQEGSKAYVSNILDDFAERVTAKEVITHEDRVELLERLINNGAIEMVKDPYYKDIRETLRKNTVYVSNQVKSEFGDDWRLIRNRAFGAGIYLTTDERSKARGIEAWNAELAEQFPGSFDAEETDLAGILEKMIDLAEEGKSENVSLTEMMRQQEREYGWSQEAQMDDFMDQLDRLIDTFAQKAALEIKVETKNFQQRMEERERFREIRERAAANKLDSRMQENLLKKAKELRELAKTQPNAVKAEVDALIGDLDLWARSISPQGLEDLNELQKEYKKYLSDKNNLRRVSIENRLDRLNEKHISEMTPEEIATLSDTVVGMITQIKNANRQLSDDRRRTNHECATQFAEEIRQSSGSKVNFAEHVREWHLDARRFLEHITGHARGEGHRLANETENCARRYMHYRHAAESAVSDPFLWKTENGKRVKDKENIKWLKKSMGRNAERIKIEVPVIQADGKAGSQTFEITPMMRVALYMHSLNEQNLNHIKEGGIEIPNLKEYLKGNLKGAYDESIVVKLQPEQVRWIASQCTAQEKAFARCLQAYFNISAGMINEVSMVLEGYERAGIEHYFPIQVAQDFIESADNAFVYDANLQSLGPLKNRETGATTPIILADAYDVYQMHVEAMAKYYGYAIFARDLQAITDHVFHEEGKPFSGSVERTIKQTWGSTANQYIQKLLQDISNPKQENKNLVTKTLARLRGMRAAGSLNGNLKVMMSQFASLPYAMAYLNRTDLLYGMSHKADMEIMNKYTDLDWYRKQGNSTMELGELTKNHVIGDHIPVLTTGIQWMDSFTTRRIWEAAEHWVEKNTEYKRPSDRKAALSGTDPFYQAVAKKYEETVFRTQPNYTTILRPDILRGQGELMKNLTMYKTVPFQNNGMLQEANERLRNDARRYRENKSRENKALLQESRKFAYNTKMGVLQGTLLYVAMGALALAGTFRGKRFQDDDGEYTFESILKGLGINALETYAGMWMYGGEALTAAEGFIDAALKGKTGYSSGSFQQISSLQTFADLDTDARKLLAALASGDSKALLKAVKELSQELAIDALGFPAKNIETYLLAATKWISPDLAAQYTNLFDEMDKQDLSDASLRDQKAVLRVFMDNRTEGLSDEVLEEIQRLWNAGCGNAVPNGIEQTITIDGESFALTQAQQEAYRNSWSKIVSDAMEELMNSDVYLEADDKGRSRILSTLYEYANAVAKNELSEDYEPDSWIQTGQKLGELGMSAEEYLAYYMKNKDLSNSKEKMDALKESGWTDEQMETYWVERMSSDTELQKFQYLKDNGVGWLEAMDLLDIGETESLKLNEAQQAVYDAAWDRIVKGSVDDLYQTDGYLNADTDTKTEYLKKLFAYAGQAAKAEATSDYTPDKWVKAGLEAEKLGVSAAEYAVFNAELGKLDSKNAKGESEDGLLLHRKIQLLRKTGWTEKQMETVFMDYIAEDAKQKEMKTMRSAGFTVKQALDVLQIYGKQENWQKAQQVIKTSASDNAKIKALELYLSKQDYPAVQAGYTLKVDMNVWVQCKNNSDANGNGSITQEEIEKYLRGLDISTQEKAYIWQMISHSTWNSTKQYYPKTYKKNPFSTGFGEEIWHLIYD